MWTIPHKLGQYHCNDLGPPVYQQDFFINEYVKPVLVFHQSAMNANHPCFINAEELDVNIAK